ncbi:MAG: DMT family transporter [Pseudomonadota bacterium]|nr:DMT family transporter [Pseudomonadota bacterium]
MRGQVTSRKALPFVGVVLVLLVGLAWGFNWPAIKIAVTEISPWTYRAVSLVIAALGMLSLAHARVGRLRLPRREIVPIAVLALLNVTGFQMLVAFGLSMMEATRGVILGHTQSLWVVLLGAFILRETVSGAQLWGLLLGLAAMALVIAPEARMLGSAPVGAFLVVAAAVSWGLGTVLFKRFDLSLTSIELTAWQLVFGGIPIALCALILDPLPDVSALSTRTIIAVLYTAFIAQWFGQWAWFRSLQLLPANVAAIGSLSIPIVGLYASALLLEESITWIELLALAMVLVALGLVLIGPDGLYALKRRHHK